jgi:hypothetical protein
VVRNELEDSELDPGFVSRVLENDDALTHDVLAACSFMRESRDETDLQSTAAVWVSRIYSVDGTVAYLQAAVEGGCPELRDLLSDFDDGARAAIDRAYPPIDPADEAAIRVAAEAAGAASASDAVSSFRLAFYARAECGNLNSDVLAREVPSFARAHDLDEDDVWALHELLVTTLCPDRVAFVREARRLAESGE